MHRTTKILNEIDLFLTSDSSKKSQYIKIWRSNGSYPRVAMPQLLDILAYYFKQGEEVGFSNKLSDYALLPTLVEKFLDALNSVHFDDILFFSAQSMPVNSNKIYAAAVLKKIIICDLGKIEVHDMKDVMKSLARIVSRYDPSYIVDSSTLVDIYSQDRLGSFFSFSHFKTNCLPFLRKIEKAAHHTDIIDKLDIFYKKHEKSECFTDEIIKDLRDIYQYRWNKIKGTSLDYTRCLHGKKQDDKNFWIVVAQMLSGGKLIESGYYKFLMPSLEYDEVLSTGEPLEYYPLSHFVLSENAEQLLSLDMSLEYFAQNPNDGVFCNRDTWPLKDFTEVEKTRIRFAATRFSSRPELLKRNLSSVSVQRSTVNIVYELLLASMRKPITVDELQIAYLTFWKKIRELSVDERVLLYSQRVVWNGRDYSISNLLGKIALGDVSEACISIWSMYLLKFVLDYRPEANLSPEIDCPRAFTMREQSAKRVFNESKADIVKRNEMLMVSLLTYPFEPYMSSSCKLSLLDCNNNCDGILQPFFLKLKSYVESNSGINAYQELMSQMVLPRLLKVEQSKLSDDVELWLNLVRDENYLTQSNLCVEPKTLFCLLSTFQIESNYQPTLKLFIEDLIKVLTHRANDSIINIRANVKLKLFLAKLPVIVQDKIKELLSTNKTPVLTDDFIKSLYDYVVNKDKMAVQSTRIKSSFFSSSSDQHQTIRPDISGLNSAEEVISFINKQKVTHCETSYNQR